MNRTQKEEAVARLSARLEASPTLYLTDFTGLNVAAMTEFRRRLRAAGVEYVVVKNTLAQRALTDDALGALRDHLSGPTGVVVAGADPVGAAKVLSDFRREYTLPGIKLGVVDGRLVGAEDVDRLATLPPRDQLLAHVAGTLQSPLGALVGALNGLLFNVVGLVEALRAQREGAAS